MKTYVIRYEVPGEVSQVSEPIDAKTPREAAEGVMRRDGPISAVIGLADGDTDEVLTVHEIVTSEKVAVSEVAPDQ